MRSTPILVLSSIGVHIIAAVGNKNREKLKTAQKKYDAKAKEKAARKKEESTEFGRSLQSYKILFVID